MIPADAVVYSAVLRPHRSAGRAAARLIVLLMMVIWLPAAVVFVVVGAWPILPFLGLEVVLLYAALRLNQHAGNAFESINLTRAALTVNRVDHWGKQRSFSFPPQWLQVNIEDLTPTDNRLELRSHGRSLTIAAFLLPQERVALASSLRNALSRLSRPIPEARQGASIASGDLVT